MKTKSDVLEETLEYYLIQNNRRGSSGLRKGNCSYRTREGFMCAVGRCLTTVGLNMAPMGSVVACPEVLNGLRPEYMHLKGDQQFWSDLQDLHDTYIEGRCDANAVFTHNTLRTETSMQAPRTGEAFLEQLREKYRDVSTDAGQGLQNEVGVADGIS